MPKIEMTQDEMIGGFKLKRGNVYEVPDWVADRVVEKGVGHKAGLGYTRNIPVGHFILRKK